MTAFLVLGFLYLLIAGAMNDSGLPYLVVFFVAFVAVLHFIVAKILYDRRP